MIKLGDLHREQVNGYFFVVFEKCFCNVADK